MKKSTTALLEYLILKVLADKDGVVRVLYDYFVEGASPSSIAAKYGLSKHQVRGYIQRIVEKTGSSTKAKVLIKHITPIIIKLKPVAKRVNGALAICSLCNEELPIQIMEDHIKKKHTEIVNECINSVIEMLKKNVMLKSRM